MLAPAAIHRLSRSICTSLSGSPLGGIFEITSLLPVTAWMSRLSSGLPAMNGRAAVAAASHGRARVQPQTVLLFLRSVALGAICGQERLDVADEFDLLGLDWTAEKEQGDIRGETKLHSRRVGQGRGEVLTPASINGSRCEGKLFNHQRLRVWPRVSG